MTLSLFSKTSYCVAMQYDVFENNDSVIDHQADCGREPSQGHQIETLAGELQHDKCEEQGGWNHQSRNERSPPIPQKQNENRRGENQTEKHGVTDTGDGVVHNR